MFNNAKRGDYNPVNINNHVPSMSMAADLTDGVAYIDLGEPTALDADGILDGVTVGSAESFTPSDFRTLYVAGMGSEYGRGLTVTGAASGDQVVTITGRDYLGQVMIEQFTISGTTPQQGKKAFFTITGITTTAGTGGISMDVGWNDVLGLPYKGVNLEKEYLDDVVTSSGTFVAGVATATAQTATTGDPRGTFDSNTASDGSKNFKIRYVVDAGNLHGNVQYSG